VGFSRAAILIAFLTEALLLGLLPGVVGLLAASFAAAPRSRPPISRRFAGARVQLQIDASIVLWSLAFALAMGFVGLAPARAARMKIVDALRAA
jgi:putative ABC transport system permease protein